jgi:hypothetical protein
MEMETISKDPVVAKESQYLKNMLGYQNYRPICVAYHILVCPPKVKVSDFSWDPYIVNYRKSCPLQLL